MARHEQPDPIFIVTAQIAGDADEVQEIAFARIDDARDFGVKLNQNQYGHFFIYSVSLSTGVQFLEMGECTGLPEDDK